MITNEEAALITYIEVEPWWKANTPQSAELYIRPTMYVDEHAILVEYGDRRWVADGDVRYLVIDQPRGLVNRSNGEFKLLSDSEARVRAEKMRQVSLTDKEIRQLKLDLQK